MTTGTDTLKKLSDRESELLTIVRQTKGTIDEIDEQLENNGIFSRYLDIHADYWELFNTSSDSGIKLEALKRGVFLSWFVQTEPSFLTGIRNLNANTVLNFYGALENSLVENKLDKEFLWMLTYYSSWGSNILGPTNNTAPTLKSFVESVETLPHAADHAPLASIPRATTENRGQMGDYWDSIIESVTRHQRL